MKLCRSLLMSEHMVPLFQLFLSSVHSFLSLLFYDTKWNKTPFVRRLWLLESLFVCGLSSVMIKALVCFFISVSVRLAVVRECVRPGDLN